MIGRQSTFIAIDQQPALPSMLTCLNCGCDENVVIDNVWVGGVGYEQRPQCFDLVACWLRHETRETEREAMRGAAVWLGERETMGAR